MSRCDACGLTNAHTSDCLNRRPAAVVPEGVTPERHGQLQQLARWHSDDPEAQMIIASALAEHGPDLATMAAERPEVFDDLWEVVSTMIEEMPTEHRPGWAQ